jgi:hypothetical protein
MVETKVFFTLNIAPGTLIKNKFENVLSFAEQCHCCVISSAGAFDNVSPF